MLVCLKYCLCSHGVSPSTSPPAHRHHRHQDGTYAREHFGEVAGGRHDETLVGGRPRDEMLNVGILKHAARLGVSLEPVSSNRAFVHGSESGILVEFMDEGGLHHLGLLGRGGGGDDTESHGRCTVTGVQGGRARGTGRAWAGVDVGAMCGRWPHHRDGGRRWRSRHSRHGWDGAIVGQVRAFVVVVFVVVIVGGGDGGGGRQDGQIRGPDRSIQLVVTWTRGRFVRR